MSYVIKPRKIKVKDSEGVYREINAVAEETTEQKLAAINAAGTTQVGAVNTAGAEALNEIADQVSNIQAAGAEQITAVEEKGTEVLQSIPDDYTDVVFSTLRVDENGMFYIYVEED